MSWVASVLVAVILGGSCPRWQLSGWQLFWYPIMHCQCCLNFMFHWSAKVFLSKQFCHCPI